MGLNATELLGTPQLAGVRVNSRGFYYGHLSSQRGAMGGSFAGGVGTAAGGMIGAALVRKWASKKAAAEEAEVPDSAPEFQQMAFLCVTERDVALVGIDARTTARLTSVLARVPRSDIASVELGKAGPLVSKPLTITLANGDRWMLEVRR